MKKIIPHFCTLFFAINIGFASEIENSLSTLYLPEIVLSKAYELSKIYPKEVRYLKSETELEVRFEGYDVSTQNLGKKCHIYLAKHFNESISYSFGVTESENNDVNVISVTAIEDKEILKNVNYVLKVRNSSTRPYFLGYRTEAELSINGSMLQLKNKFIQTPFKQKVNSKKLFNLNNAKSSAEMNCTSPYFFILK